MFRVETEPSLDAMLPHVSKVFKTEARAINTAHKFLQDNQNDGVLVVTDALHEPVLFIVRDADLTGGDIKDFSPSEWEAV